MRTGADGLWRVIYMAHSLQVLKSIEELLRGEGFLVRRREESGAGAYELCVLESEAREARQFILEKGY